MWHELLVEIPFFQLQPCPPCIASCIRLSMVIKAGWTAFLSFLAIRAGSRCFTELGRSRFARPRLQRARRLSSNMHSRTWASAFSPHSGDVQVSPRNNGLSGHGVFSEHAQRDLPADLELLDVSAGYVHTCAKGADGQCVCFGDGSFGQCDAPEDL